MTNQAVPAGTDEHVCKPGASNYYCPAAEEIESDCHGGFDVCCGHPDLHQTVLPCALAVLRRSHAAHGWEPQPGMTPVHCPGHGDSAAEPRGPIGWARHYAALRDQPEGTEETRQAKPTDTVRDDLLHAIDFNHAVGLGYATPDALLDAYDASREAL
ncbi:hypothetical protein [Streptomyces sp. SID10815]|uniref:hypothetical protein n=1 Tax=Streptomyces sp. SID10815 TaxID=2706027 RepID=UPI0013CB298C|nr:hypothetical protein [Streptomyces sp. SID10815]NEA52377.1 hypothetical protein [Streptomyces sp. SID10815]